MSVPGKSLISLSSTWPQISPLMPLPPYTHPRKVFPLPNDSILLPAVAPHNLTLPFSLIAYFVCLFCLLTRLQYLWGGGSVEQEAPGESLISAKCKKVEVTSWENPHKIHLSFWSVQNQHDVFSWERFTAYNFSSHSPQCSSYPRKQFGVREKQRPCWI